MRCAVGLPAAIPRESCGSMALSPQRLGRTADIGVIALLRAKGCRKEGRIVHHRVEETVGVVLPRLKGTTGTML